MIKTGPYGPAPYKLINVGKFEMHWAYFLKKDKFLHGNNGLAGIRVTMDQSCQ